MPYFYKTFTCITLFLLSSCNFNQVMINPLNKEDYSISFDSSVPFHLNKEIKSAFNFYNENDTEPKTKIYIKDYSLQDYTIYAGSALRSLEGEITAKFQIKIENSEKAQDKSIEIVKRYKSNELNPFSEKEMIKKVKESIYKEILDEIIKEVLFFEM
jgi:antitoxin component YwqK of YwqJK toxin-antitoxin module